MHFFGGYIKIFLQNDKTEKWFYLFFYNACPRNDDAGQKNSDHEWINESLQPIPWICRVFWFREHLDLWIDVKCGQLVHCYLRSQQVALFRWTSLQLLAKTKKWKIQINKQTQTKTNNFSNKSTPFLKWYFKIREGIQSWHEYQILKNT